MLSKIIKVANLLSLRHKGVINDYSHIANLFKNSLRNNIGASLIEILLSAAVLTSLTGAAISSYSDVVDIASRNVDIITAKQISTILNISNNCDYILFKSQSKPLDLNSKNIIISEISKYFDGNIPTPQQEGCSFFVSIDETSGFVVTVDSSSKSAPTNSNDLNLIDPNETIEININQNIEGITN